MLLGLMLTQRLKHIRIPVVFGLFALSATVHALFNLLLQTAFATVAVIMPAAMFFGEWMFFRNAGENQLTDTANSYNK